MDEEFQSLIVTNPDLVDEGIDVSGLRTQTDTSPYLLGNIPDYSGIQYSTLAPTKYTDLMRLYSEGLPMFDTPQAAAPITTAPDTGDEGQGTLPIDTIQPIDTPIITDLTDDQINEFATEDTTMPPMLSPDMGASMVTDTTPVNTAPINMSPLADEQFVDTDSGLNYLNNVTDEELYGITEAEQTPPGGGDPEMFYDAPETYSPISPGLDDPLENVTDEELYGITQTSGSIPPGEEGGPGYIEPPTPDNIIAKANIPDYLDNVTLTSAQAPQSQMPQGSPGQLNPYEPENFLADKDINKLDTSEVDIPDNYFTDDSSTDIEDIPVELPATNIETAIDPQAVNTILGSDGITYDAVTGNPIYEDLDEQAAATDLTLGTQDLVTEEDIADNTSLLQKLGLPADFDLKQAAIEAGINLVAGVPITLIAKAVGAVLPSGISATTNKAREVGLLTGDTTVTQDKYGINTQSQFGDYNQYNVDRVDELEKIVADQTSRGLTNTIQMRELADRKNYLKVSGADGDIQETGDASVAEDSQDLNLTEVRDDMAGIDTGDAQIAEQIAEQNRIEEEARIEAERRALQEINAAAAREQAAAEQAAAEQRAREETAAKQREMQVQIAAAERAAAEQREREAQRRALQNINAGGNGGNGGTSGSSGGSSGGGGESQYGGFCFDPNTRVQMADGSDKKIKEIKLGDNTKGGEVTGVFQFKATDEIHDYKGVTVAGSHYVKEDGKFIMVQDSPLAVKIDKIPVVYSLDTTDRRIFINDIEFADYNGDGVAKNFLDNAGINLTGFDKEVLRQVQQRLI